MVFAYFVLGVALTISAIAAYYSIVGLAAIFAAATVPIIIMGASLEIGKLTAATWLKLNWRRAGLSYKLYLVPAVAFLMFLTSMGIFGFLSKAHLDQGAASEESTAQITRLTSEITRRQDIIKRADEKIKSLETSGTGADAQVQAQIDKEQTRIDAAYKRIEPAIQEQQNIIDSISKLYSDQLAKIDGDLAKLQSSLDRNDIQQAQALIGVQPDGRLGPRTSQAIREYRDRLQAQKQDLTRQIEQSNNNPRVQEARKEIQRLRASAENQIAESNQLINRLRNQVGKNPINNIDSLVDEQQQRIKQANTELDELIEQKYKLESEYRKLEAEVGPVKYIAELIYGDNTDKALLEQAVRWVIILIVAVFDPLALVLLLAAQQSFKWAQEDAAAKISAQNTKDTVPVKEEEFNIDNQVYLKEPWIGFPPGKPIVAKPDIKELGNCSVCNSELVDGNFLGAVCSNVFCSSFNISTVDTIEPTANILTADSTTVIKEIQDVVVIKPEEQVEPITVAPVNVAEPKVVEAKRAYKAPMASVPETMNVRRKLSPEPDNAVNKTSNTGFGTSFPEHPNADDIFLRVDLNPNRLYKFVNNKWIEIDRSQTDHIPDDQYLEFLMQKIDDQYIEFLIEKIKTGECQLEQLNAVEQQKIINKLQNNEKT